MSGTTFEEIFSKLYNIPSLLLSKKSLNIIGWNTFAEHLFSFTTKGEKLQNFSFTDLFSTTTDSFQTALQQNVATVLLEEASIHTKDKNDVPVTLLALPTNSLEENYTVLILNESQLKKINYSESALEYLIKGIKSSFMTVTLDSEGFILSTNASFLKSSRWTPKRVIGKTFWNLFPSEEPNTKIAHNIWKTITNGNVWQGEVEQITKDGESYWVLLTAIPQVDEDGLQNYLLIQHDITKDKTIQLQLEKIAYIDTETGLMNSHRLHQLIDEMIEDKRHFSFVYLSVDNYFTLKDIHHLPVGENLITEFTKRLKMYFQDSSTARINENDFVVITPLPEWYIQGFLTYLQQNPIYNGNVAVPLSLSGGITRFPEDQSSFAELMKASIATISQVREAGGGYIASLSKDTHKALNRKSIVEKRLLLALDQENLKVLYQPQFDIKTGKITAVEALVRWDDDEIGVVSPDELIPIAEETGLIHNIGKFMIRKACEQALKWQQAGLNLKVSINSSVREFRDKNMAKSILETLAETGCPAKLLQIEITEKFALEAEAEQSITNQMRTLENEGILFILDDFGTGYASFRYIQLLPISMLKIDQMFTKSVLNSEKLQRLVHGMVQLGKSMNLTVLAEGVESEEQKDLLTSFGCDALQGYFFSKPITAEEVSALLKK